MKRSILAAVAVAAAVTGIVAHMEGARAEGSFHDAAINGAIPAAERAKFNHAAVDPTTTSAIVKVKTGKGPKYSSIIARHAAANGVPVSLAMAVVGVESNYRPNARGRAGEIGLMQIKPATARMMGYTGSAKGLYDPETNIKYGMKYLGMAHKLGGGTTCGTILKYNAGHAAKRMNPVSAGYCSKVKRRLGS